MNKPIMRRGLSPEGRLIRQKHQGSLLNDEHGVTSLPLHKKIEKDFVKETVMRLKEIQAKCRSQELKSTTGIQPVKALRDGITVPPNVENSDTVYVKGMEIDLYNESEKVKERDGSAHSDYFSLSDETAIEHQEPQILNEKIKQDRKCQVDSLSDNLHKSLHLRPKSANRICMTRITSPIPTLVFQETNTFPSSSTIPSKKYGDVYPHSVNKYSNGVSNLLERLKCKKPACDTNAGFIWRDIQKYHKTLVSSNEEPTQCISNNLSHRSLTPGVTSTIRSHSLDRASSSRKHHRNSGSRMSKSNYQSVDNVSISSEKSSSISSTQTSTAIIAKPLQSDIFCDTSDKLCKESQIEASSHLSESLPDLAPSLQNSLSLNASNENLSIRPGFDQRLSPLNRQQKFDATYKKEKKEVVIKTSSTPLLPKKDSIPIYRQNLLATHRTSFLKSKSSSNLIMAGEPPPSYRRGQVPKYLQVRKANNQRQQDALAAIDPLCPPGHIALPEHEKKNTLHLLKQGQADVMQQLATLPVAQDTLRVKKLKLELESKLDQIEEGIQIFSQTKVYVVNDE